MQSDNPYIRQIGARQLIGWTTTVGIATGMVAGLATITPASGTVGPAGAMLIGLFAGSVCFYATQIVKSYFQIDDSLDVFPVHGVGGILGILMLAFIGKPDGFLGAGAAGFDPSVFEQFMIQLQGVLVICLWTLVFSWIALKITSMMTNLRVGDESEHEPAVGLITMVESQDPIEWNGQSVTAVTAVCGSGCRAPGQTAHTGL